MSLVRCELAVTPLMKQLKGDRLSMRRIRVIKPKMYACLVRGWLTPSLMTPVRQEREVGRSWNREIRRKGWRWWRHSSCQHVLLARAVTRAPAAPGEASEPLAHCLSEPIPSLLWVKCKETVALSCASPPTQWPGFQTGLHSSGSERQGGSLAGPVTGWYPVDSSPLGRSTPPQPLLSDCASTASRIS